MEQLVSLGREKAIEAIQGKSVIMYKHGVWNNYRRVSFANAVDGIRKSGYGADVYKDEEDVYYVSCPCDSDMW